MRTVEDLREALASLEANAPAVGDLLVKSSRASQPVERRVRRWVLPAATAVLTIAVVLGVAAVAASRLGSGQATRSGHATSGAAAGGPGLLVPFRLTSSLSQLTLVDVHSDATGQASYGTAVVAEYGMEVTIDVRTAGGQSTRSASAARTDVDGVQGWIDTTCGVRAAASSAASSTATGNSTPPEFNPDCSLTYDSGPWHVAIYVAGPGGGSRKITSEQFLQIGTRLELAAAPGDSSSWFGSHDLLPS